MRLSKRNALKQWLKVIQNNESVRLF